MPNPNIIGLGGALDGGGGGASQNHNVWCGAHSWALTGTWAFQGSGASAALITATSSGQLAYLDLPLIYQSGSAILFPVITQIVLKVVPGGASAMTFKISQNNNANNTSATTNTDLSTLTSSGSSAQLITFSGLNISAADTTISYLSAKSGQANDVVYGALITFTTLVF